MPAVGDQHRIGSTTMSSSSLANPFEEPQTHTSEYTAKEIATLASRLNKRLGPEYLSSRPGAGGQKVHYITADKCINLANEVFGFNGWSSAMKNIQVDFMDESPNTGKVSLGLSVIVRVTLRDGTYHEDIGYGHTENCKGKAAAFEKAKKEGTTDALKRALRTFGNVLGNCIYDKEYLSKVTKVKPDPVKWNVDNLHRHADFVAPKKQPAPSVGHVKKEPESNGQYQLPSRLPDPPVGIAEESTSLEFEGEFGSDLFDEADFGEQHIAHPDEVVLDQEPQPQPRLALQQGPSTTRQPSRNNDALQSNSMITPSKPQRPPAAGPAPGGRPSNLPPAVDRGTRQNANPVNEPYTPNPKTPNSYSTAQATHNIVRPANGKPSNPSSNLPPTLPTTDQSKTRHNPSMNNAMRNSKNSNGNNSPTKPSSPLSSQIDEDKQPVDPAVGFYSARAADALRNNPYEVPKSAPVFDPRFVSPSIRKTVGFDHNRSAPVVRKTLQALPPPTARNTPQPGKINNLPSSQTNTNASSDVINTTAGASHISSEIGKKPAPALSGAPGNNSTTPIGKPPLTTSYRPPTRRSMPGVSNNNNGNTSNNTAGPPVPNNNLPPNPNGKRPPLTDMTNVPPGPGDEMVKKAKMGDANTVHLNPQQQQQRQQQRQHQQQSHTGPS